MKKATNRYTSPIISPRNMLHIRRHIVHISIFQSFNNAAICNKFSNSNFFISSVLRFFFLRTFLTDVSLRTFYYGFLLRTFLTAFPLTDFLTDLSYGFFTRVFSLRIFLMDLLLTDFSYGLSSYGFFLTQYEAQRNPSDQRIVTAAMATMAASGKEWVRVCTWSGGRLKLTWEGSPPIQNRVSGMLVGRKAVKKHPNKHRCRKVWTLTVRVGLDRSVQAGKSGP